jgi:hypothetical protein
MKRILGILVALSVMAVNTAHVQAGGKWGVGVHVDVAPPRAHHYYHYHPAPHHHRAPHFHRPYGVHVPRYYYPPPVPAYYAHPHWHAPPRAGFWLGF